ncbi:MAG: GNAT family N-acetyltransferase [Enterobacterales bacterium]|nr:GNAT family N-acetyltransferase [Enterobacterales bacterium]
MTNTTIFQPQQKLRGKRLMLRPLDTSDFDALFTVANDPLLWQQHPQSDRFKRHVFEEFFQGAVASKAAYVVIDTTSDKVIGSSRFNNPNHTESSIEIGWTFLARSHWGGGYNAELKDIMLRFALPYFNHIYFCVGETNYRSLAAVEKLGAQLCDIKDSARPGNVFYELTNETYVGLKKYGKVNI